MKTCLRLTPLLLAGALTLAGCAEQAPPETAPDAATATAEPAPAPSANAINAPIAAEDIETRIEPVGAPVHLAATDTIRFTVRIHNDGRAALADEGTAPVRLGVMLMGPEGADKAPGVRDFQRMGIPVIAPGTSAEVTGEIPVAPLLGLGVRLELVQEGVNWFASYGEVPLDLGTLQRCPDAAATVCDADGQPLASE